MQEILGRPNVYFFVEKESGINFHCNLTIFYYERKNKRKTSKLRREVDWIPQRDKSPRLHNPRRRADEQQQF